MTHTSTPSPALGTIRLEPVASHPPFTDKQLIVNRVQFLPVRLKIAVRVLRSLEVRFLNKLESGIQPLVES